MELAVQSAEAIAVLIASGVHEIYPTFSDMWVVDIRRHQWTLAAPVSTLMPRSLGHNMDRFKKIAPFGHLVAKATWKCQERKESDDVLVQNDTVFKFFAVPDNDGAYVHVKGRKTRMVSGFHGLDFELIMYDEFGVSTVIGSGTSTLKVYRETSSTGPIVVRTRPDDPIPPFKPRHLHQQEEIPVVMEDREDQVAASEPSQTRRVSLDNSIVQMSNFDESPVKFTLVNATGSRPQDSKALILELSKLDVVPQNITFEPMPTMVKERFLFHFEVDKLQDASKIQERIRFGGGCERFKIGVLQDIKPFFTLNLPLRKLIKTTVLSHRYYERNGFMGDVAAMAEIGYHVKEALKDESVLEEVKVLMSKKGRRVLEHIQREMSD